MSYVLTMIMGPTFDFICQYLNISDVLIFICPYNGIF